MKTQTHAMMRDAIWCALQMFYPFTSNDYEAIWLATHSFDDIIAISEYAASAGYGDLWAAMIAAKRNLTPHAADAFCECEKPARWVPTDKECAYCNKPMRR